MPIATPTPKTPTEFALMTTPYRMAYTAKRTILNPRPNEVLSVQQAAALMADHYVAGHNGELLVLNINDDIVLPGGMPYGDCAKRYKGRIYRTNTIRGRLPGFIQTVDPASTLDPFGLPLVDLRITTKETVTSVKEAKRIFGGVARALADELGVVLRGGFDVVEFTPSRGVQIEIGT